MSQETFDRWVLDVAKAVAQKSKDPSTKVGAVLVRPDNSFASVGYNGFPRRMEDKDEWWNEREEKYRRVIHAEMNALLACKEDPAGYTMYITHQPCCDCAKHLAASGLGRVVYQYNEAISTRFGISEDILWDSRVQTRMYDDETF